MQSNAAVASRLDEVLQEERDQAALDRQNLLSQITNLVMAQGEAQDARLGAKIEVVRKDVTTSKEIFEASQTQYSKGMDAWGEKEGQLIEEVLRSRETLKSKLKEDWMVRSYSLTVFQIQLTYFAGCEQAQCISSTCHEIRS
jgi:kinesin family protein 11